MVVEDPMPTLVWKTMKAVPVSPIQLNLRPLSVLVWEHGSFWVIGDLASLCLERNRADLENAMRVQTNYSFNSLGEIQKTMGRDSRWFSRLQVWQTGWAAGLKNVHQWKVHIPSHQSESIEDRVFMTITDNFVPDRNNPYFARGKTRDVSVVKEVLTAPSLSVYALDRTGANIRLAVPPIPPVPLSVDVGVGGEVGSEYFSRITGPVGADGQPQPLPFAFRGWKFRYENGFFRRGGRARYQADAAGASTEDEPILDEDHAKPWDDPDMADFVKRDEWCTTIEVPTQTA